MFKIVSFGEALVDLLSNRVAHQHNSEEKIPFDSSLETSPESFQKFAGGAPANVAAGTARLGAESYFLGKVGNDSFGDFLKNSLQSMGVKTDYLLQTTAGKTALAFVSLDEKKERTFDFYRNKSADLLFQSHEVDKKLFNSKTLFHFCSNTLTEHNIRKTTFKLIEIAKQKEAIISFDINFRPLLWPEHANQSSAQLAADHILTCLEKSDIVKASLEEWRLLSAHSPHKDLAKHLLAKNTRLILITNGSNSVRCLSPNHESQLQPPQIKQVDSTAAGDAFTSGVLFQLAQQADNMALQQIWHSLEKLIPVIQFGCACGAYAASQKGAFTSLPTQAQAEGYFN